jgi:hypothetical protein
MPADGLDGVRYRGGVNWNQVLVWNLGTCSSDAKGEIQVTEIIRMRVPKWSTGTDWPVVALKSGNSDGAKGPSYSVLLKCQLEET